MRMAIAGATGLIGTRLTAVARAAGHDVVEISRAIGYDLLRPEPGRLEAALAGVEAVVDTTSTGPTKEAEAASRLFTTMSRNLGAAASAAGVRRTVVLSIVGADRSPDFDYHVATVAHEQAIRDAAPGPLVLRATQFHDFARQMLEWNQDGSVARIIDVPTQPVDTMEVVRLLLDLATGVLDHDAEVAGPRQERLVDLVQRYAAHVGVEVRVEPVEAPASLAAGSMLPDHDGVLICGVDWTTWLARQPT